MRVLVTGATGFIGGHLVDALVRRGDEVTALARSAVKAAVLAQRGVRVVPGDVWTDGALAQAVEGQDVVYHLAGMVAARSEAEFVRCNRDGTANLVHAAERAGAPRLILVSSLAAAGPSRRGRPHSGEEPAAPVTAYGRSKLAAEQAARQSGLPWVIVRPPMVYGPRDREVLRVFRLARWGVAPVFGDGSQELSAVHSSDLAAALVVLGSAGEISGRTYYSCHCQVFTSSELVRTIGETMGKAVRMVPLPPTFARAALGVTELAARLRRETTLLTRDKANEFLQPAWTADPGPLMRDTGWCAEFDLRAGLADTYAWYRSAGWL